MASKRFDEKVTIRMTKAMLADLQTVAAKARTTMPGIIRQAIRNYLDDTGLTLGTRRTFDRRFQHRMGETNKSSCIKGISKC